MNWRVLADIVDELRRDSPTQWQQRKALQESVYSDPQFRGVRVCWSTPIDRKFRLWPRRQVTGQRRFAA